MISYSSYRIVVRNKLKEIINSVPLTIEEMVSQCIINSARATKCPILEASRTSALYEKYFLLF